MRYSLLIHSLFCLETPKICATWWKYGICLIFFKIFYSVSFSFFFSFFSSSSFLLLLLFCFLFSSFSFLFFPVLFCTLFFLFPSFWMQNKQLKTNPRPRDFYMQLCAHTSPLTQCFQLLAKKSLLEAEVHFGVREWWACQAMLGNETKLWMWPKDTLVVHQLLWCLVNGDGGDRHSSSRASSCQGMGTRAF